MKDLLVKKNTLKAFALLDQRLAQPLKLLVAGGAAMILEYGHPEGTRDVDALSFQGFEKIEDIKDAIYAVAQELNIDADWINPYFGNFTFVLPKDYVSRLRQNFSGKHLQVLVLGPEDLLMMKLHAGRPKDDAHIRRLLKTQKINLKVVESQLQHLIDRGVSGSDKAAARLDDYLEDLGLDG